MKVQSCSVKFESCESGRGQPHSRTLRVFCETRLTPIGLGVRLPSAAFLWCRVPKFPLVRFSRVGVVEAAIDN
jgi:hypothetical protein